jgi:DNA invertase Pin-like site-specific DNA recombinase
MSRSGPTVYGYGRHSTSKQGLTETAQRTKVEDYISSHPELSKFRYGGWMYDSAVSGGSDMFERGQGRVLWALVQPGDHIVWAKLDRAFRNTADGIKTLSMLASKGVRVHSLGREHGRDTAISKLISTIEIGFAEFEKDCIGERTRDALTAKREAGLPYNSGVPFGWRKIGTGKLGRFWPDQKERDQIFTMVGLRAAGWSYDRIVAQMRGTRRPNGREWNRNTARRAVLAAEAGFPKSLQVGQRLGEGVA